MGTDSTCPDLKQFLKIAGQNSMMKFSKLTIKVNSILK
jgi:hypothetical protein